MNHRSRLKCRGTLVAGLVLLFVFLVPPASGAKAQGILDVSYVISVARVPIGRLLMASEIGNREYMVSMSGHVSGLNGLLLSGEIDAITRGVVSDGRLSPTSFRSNSISGKETLGASMELVAGNVKNLKTTHPSQDRVPVTEEHRQNIIDPLSAMLVPVAGLGLNPKVCQRTVAIFDGYQRFDLKLAFGRIGKDGAALGHDGPTVRCTATHQQLAGHRTFDPLVNLLAGREIEVILAPVSGAPVLAPLGLSVTTLLADLTVTAQRFRSRPSRSSAVAPGVR